MKTIEPTYSYAPKDDAALVASLSKDTSNGEDNLIDYNINDISPNYTKTRVEFFLGQISLDIQKRKIS